MKSFISLFYLNFIFSQIYSQDDVFVDSKRNIQNFVIQISKDIQKYDKNLIENIKITMQQASKALYKATSNLDKVQSGIKFGKIYISVPNEWQAETGALIKNVTDKAHFKIVPKKENDNSDKPKTKQYLKCGVPGKYSRFPVEFFKDKSINEKDFMRKGKRIMREFVKLRYGVFSEIPYKNILFVNDNNSLIKGICNQNIQWKVNYSPEKCSDENSVCKYTIEKNQNHNYSVMFDVDSNTSEYFCNDNDRPHNHLAYNLHNKICKGKSISSVIMKHKDFNQKSFTPSHYADPIFQIILHRGRQIVLVLDISGSMNEVADKVKTLVEKFLHQYVEESAEIGIVTFNNEVNLVSPLTKIHNGSTRKTLSDKVKEVKFFGLSKIAKGLKEGMKILLGRSNKTKNDLQTMILITDEEITKDKKIKYSDVIKALKKSEIIFHVLSFNNKSDSSLKKLAKVSNGSYQKLLANASYEKVFQKLLLKTNREELEKKVELILAGRKSYKFSYNVTFLDNVTIILVNIKKNLKKYVIKMTNVSGLDILPKKSYFKDENTQLVFNVEGRLKPGQYQLTYEKSKTKYHQQMKSSKELKSIQFSIYATNDKKSKRTINPSGSISKTLINEVDSETILVITIDFSQSDISKDEQVIAYVEMNTPSNKNIFKSLKDDGIGDDSISNDKIFTVNIYPKDLLERGFYTFIGQIEIINKITKEKLKRTVMFESLKVRDVKDSATEDKIPPAQMLTPTINIIDKLNIKLIAQATGDDSMDGQIKDYQILLQTKVEDIRNMKKSAKPYEEIDFNIDLENSKYDSKINLAIRGVDDNGNVGKWSPFVPITIKL